MYIYTVYIKMYMYSCSLSLTVTLYFILSGVNKLFNKIALFFIFWIRTPSGLFYLVTMTYTKLHPTLWLELVLTSTRHNICRYSVFRVKMNCVAGKKEKKMHVFAYFPTILSADCSVCFKEKHQVHFLICLIKNSKEAKQMEIIRKKGLAWSFVRFWNSVI